MMDRDPCHRCGLIYGHRYPCTDDTIECRKVSLQAAGGRHLAPVDTNYPWRAIVMIETIADGWEIYCVFETDSEAIADREAAETALEALDFPGATQAHYYVGYAGSDL